MAGQLMCFNTMAATAFIFLNEGQQLFISPASQKFNWYPLFLNPPIPFQSTKGENILGYGDNSLDFGLQGDTKPVTATLTIPEDADPNANYQLYLMPRGNGNGSYCFLKEGEVNAHNLTATQPTMVV